MEIIGVIIADDHLIFRKGLSIVLNEIPFVKLIAEASDGNELLNILKKRPADIVLMDINMPGMDGIEATKKMKDKYPETEVIALTMHEEIGYFNKMIEAGAKGFLLKKITKDQLEAAIKAVFYGETFFSEEFVLSAKPNKIPTQNKPSIEISEREKEVLKLIAKGYSNQEIAEKLFLSKRTVDGHKARLFEKTGAKNAPNLIMYSLKNGLI
ncbi:MAG: response regulator transcription factor [Bacteroidales bacterium]|nr:response regulator transcription factor [Bacteroidales bacterium]